MTAICKYKIYLTQKFVSLVLFTIILLSGCDKEISRSPVESDAPKGFIYINSGPSGFTIFQNGRNTGRLTPDSISYIESGNYEITLRKKYYKDTTIVVGLDENEKISVYIDIASNPSMYGKLFIDSSPGGAEIILNDSATGNITPSIFSNLVPGEYRIKYKLPNHRDLEIIGIVQSSRTNNYNGILRDTSVWVDYQVSNSSIQSNNLTAIAIDNNNVKWIGSNNRGLIRYDGVSFINFDLTNSAVPSNQINCISVDNQNRIWIGTNFGIGIFDGISWSIYNSQNSGLTSEIINIIRFDNGGTAWIGTAANLVKFDGTNWTQYDEPSGGDWISDLYFENENKFWLGTKGDGIFIFSNFIYFSLKRFEYFYPSNTVTSIAVDNHENIWFTFSPDTAGRGGISYWNGNNFTNYLPGSLQNNFSNIFIDDDDNKWIATSEGLYQFDAQNNSVVFATYNSLISSNNIKASVRDENGNVWITTNGGGLNKYKPPQ